MFRILILLSFLSLSSSSTTNSGCDQGWELFEGKCYLFSTAGKQTFTAALQFCHERGGELPLPKDLIETNGLSNLYSQNGGSSYFWIDAVALDEKFPLLYTTRSGKALEYTNWGPNKPNNPNSCTVIAGNTVVGASGAGKWYDATDCATTKWDVACVQVSDTFSNKNCPFEEDTIFVENSIKKDNIEQCQELCQQISSCKVSKKLQFKILNSSMYSIYNLSSFSHGMMLQKGAGYANIHFLV